jgi:hypothetical protein
MVAAQRLGLVAAAVMVGTGALCPMRGGDGCLQAPERPQEVRVRPYGTPSGFSRHRGASQDVGVGARAQGKKKSDAPLIHSFLLCSHLSTPQAPQRTLGIPAVVTLTQAYHSIL